MIGATGITVPALNYVAVMPEIALIAGALWIMLATAMSPRRIGSGASLFWTVAAGCVSLGFSVWQWEGVTPHGAYASFDGAVVVDGLSAFVAMTVSLTVIVAALIEEGWMRRRGQSAPEMHMLTLLSAAGAILMGAGNDLVVIFLALEIMSIGFYVLAAYDRRRLASGEAALKYLILGGFSSAVFLFGIALTYGATGSMNLAEIAKYLASNVLLHDGLLLGGMVLMLVGLAFKVAAVPFHFWAPDVYQGSPTPAAGYMAAVAKIAGFAAIIRIFVSTLQPYRADWQPAVWVVAVATLLVGGVVALVQTDIKRMLAYSSINHAGFVLLGVAAATTAGLSASLYYVLVYSFMVMGSFAVVSLVGGPADTAHSLEDYRGLYRRSPWLAWALALMLISQAGVPLTTGFIGKLEVISAAAAAHLVWLAVVAMMSAAVAAFFYLRVVMLMFSPSYGPPAGAAGAVDSGSMVAGGEGVPEPGSVAEGGEGVPGPVGVSSGGGVATASLHGEEGIVGGGGDASGYDAVAGEPAGERIPVPLSTAVALALCSGFTVFFGLFPGFLTAMVHVVTTAIPIH